MWSSPIARCLAAAFGRSMGDSMLGVLNLAALSRRLAYVAGALCGALITFVSGATAAPYQLNGSADCESHLCGFELPAVPNGTIFKVEAYSCLIVVGSTDAEVIQADIEVLTPNRRVAFEEYLLPILRGVGSGSSFVANQETAIYVRGGFIITVFTSVTPVVSNSVRCRISGDLSKYP